MGLEWTGTANIARNWWHGFVQTEGFFFGIKQFSSKITEPLRVGNESSPPIPHSSVLLGSCNKTDCDSWHKMHPSKWIFLLYVGLPPAGTLKNVAFCPHNVCVCVNFTLFCHILMQIPFFIVKKSASCINGIGIQIYLFLVQYSAHFWHLKKDTQTFGKGG
jgi:hypothetical protein